MDDRLNTSVTTYTPDACFEYADVEGGIAITGYNCYEDNDKGLAVITDVVIPSAIAGKNVTLIASGAFADNQLTSVIIPNSVETIGYDAFGNNPLEIVTIGAGIQQIDKTAFVNAPETSMALLCTYYDDDAP